jgi:hypothetical protein
MRLEEVLRPMGRYLDGRGLKEGLVLEVLEGSVVQALP